MFGVKYLQVGTFKSSFPDMDGFSIFKAARPLLIINVIVLFYRYDGSNSDEWMFVKCVYAYSRAAFTIAYAAFNVFDGFKEVTEMVYHV